MVEDKHSDHSVILNPIGKHEFTLVWLHTIGGNGRHDKYIFLNKTLCALPDGCKVIIPTAPSRAVKAFGSRAKRAWFN
jgi:hypothetical protein